MSPVLVNPYVYGVAGVTPILPTSIGNLLSWYKRGDFYSDAGTTLQTSNGGSVQQWSDSSGNGNHLSRTTQKPTVDTGVTHLTKNTLRFDHTASGGFQALNFPTSSNFSAGEFFIVLKSQSDTPAANRGIFGLNASGTGASLSTQYPDTSGHIQDSFMRAELHDWGARTTADAFHVLNTSCDGSSMDSRLDGISIGSQATPSTHNLNTSSRFLGTDGNVTSPWDGWMFELVIFSAIIGSSDRAGLYAYLTT